MLLSIVGESHEAAIFNVPPYRLAHALVVDNAVTSGQIFSH